MDRMADEDDGSGVPQWPLDIVLGLATIAGIAVLAHRVLTLGSCAAHRSRRLSGSR
jgi:hypothetical protein